MIFALKDHLVTKKEKQWLIVFGIVFMAFTTLPYVVGFLNQNQDWLFSGFLFGVEDGNSYIAKMMSGYAGAWLFRTPYTAYPQRGVLAYFPFILLGKMVVGTQNIHTQLLILFHVFRVIGGIFYILASYEFISYFISGVGLRRLGVGLAAAGGGLGWIFIILGKDNFFNALPLEFYSPETFGFLSLYGLPHLAMGRGFLLWGLLSYLYLPKMQPVVNNHFFREVFGPEKYGVRTGFYWLGLAFMQPLTVVLAWVIIISHIIFLFFVDTWKRIQLKSSEADIPWRTYLNKAFWAWIIPFPVILYTFISFSFDPFLKTWTAQNLIKSPHFIHYLMAYGMVVPFVGIGMKKVISYRQYGWWLLVSWVFVFPFLIYAPYNLQRRLAEGFWICLVSLALISLDNLSVDKKVSSPIHFLSKKLGWIFLVCFPSTLILVAMGFLGANTISSPVFQKHSNTSAFQSLNLKANINKVVLSSFEIGNALPAWAPVKVVIGHGPESIGLKELLPEVEAFYSIQTPNIQRLKLIKTFNVKYIIWSEAEREIGDWDPRNEIYLKLLGDYDGTMVFETLVE